MKEIKLTKGKVALVDDEDFEYLNQWKWYCQENRYKHDTLYYAVRSKTINKHRCLIMMHRVIMETSNELEVDHIDHNGLNNQKSNLRNCTHSQNHMNKVSKGKSRYLGVCFYIQKRKLRGDRLLIRANIVINKKFISLGYFKTEKAAARAYDRCAKKYHGEYANLNF